MSNEDETKRKRSNLSRITVGLDDFDSKVVEKMSKNRNLPLSEVIRTVVHQWIEINPEILKKNYGVDFKDITEEIKQDIGEISIDKTLKPYEKVIINELSEFFRLVEDVSIDDLADHFNVNSKIIKRIIFTHGNEIKKLGLNLKLREGRIFKS